MIFEGFCLLLYCGVVYCVCTTCVPTEVPESVSNTPLKVQLQLHSPITPMDYEYQRQHISTKFTFANLPAFLKSRFVISFKDRKMLFDQLVNVPENSILHYDVYEAESLLRVNIYVLQQQQQQQPETTPELDGWENIV